MLATSSVRPWVAKERVGLLKGRYLLRLVRVWQGVQQGIATEKAKEIVKAIKDSKLKVQASIQGDLVRVAGKDRDTLQDVIALLRGHDFGIDMQFTNYRSN